MKFLRKLKRAVRLLGKRLAYSKLCRVNKCAASLLDGNPYDEKLWSDK